MELINGTTLLAILAYIGYQLKSAPELIFNQIKRRLIYTTNIEETSELFKYFENWLVKFQSKHFKNVTATLDVDRDDEKEKDGKKEYRIITRHHIDTFIIKYKNKRLLITKGREKFENASDIRNAFHNNFKIEGWRAKTQITELLNEVVEYNKVINQNRQKIYINNHWGDWGYFGDINSKTINNVIIKDKQLIINDVSDFVTREEWYAKRGLAYKRGYLFYGSPGNGKTSLCLALAKYLNKDIQFLNLNDLEKDSSLFTVFNSIKNNSILVIEDVDAIFGKRNGDSKVSFSSLLNCMDGAFYKHGIITIMTTNHIDVIDPALIREGRIDIKLNIDNPEKKEVEEYLSLFYEESIVLDQYTQKLSMARIQEICLRNKNLKDSAIREIL